ncbi:MAG: FecR domain-containing protein [Dysgonomonas sp.]|nr:FecR domain-containing protein [Dysgonomonas sp.]
MDAKYYIELLDRFFQGLTTDEENEVLRNWIINNDSKRIFNDYFQQCWHLAPNEMDETTQDEMYANILSQIDREKKNSESRRWLRPAIIRYAATACIIIAVTFGAYFLGKNGTGINDDVVSMSVMNGQKAEITLADGTRVYINSDSKVIYDGSYNKKDRILTLEGEAYFEVAKNTEKPFIVKANGLDVEALGTSFNVKAYKTEELVSITLIEGKVKVSDSEDETLMNPNERIEYNLTNKSFAKSELHPNADHLLWRSSQLAFYGESLEEVCNTLTRMYNCTFEFKSEAVKKYTYNGIIRNNSLTNVLDFISQTASIKYEFKSDNTIVIYKK